MSIRGSGRNRDASAPFNAVKEGGVSFEVFFPVLPVLSTAISIFSLLFEAVDLRENKPLLRSARPASRWFVRESGG
jgi:hypothetical protein